jgi:hypothetical protein
LEPIPALETLHQLRDGLGLVAARFERRAESEHAAELYLCKARDDMA